ncbi:MAG: hypothetical protein IPN79_18560 [Saprospiraceae bacterium]|nr:hypothetical protein [Saprospiraceae bacterium]
MKKLIFITLLSLLAVSGWGQNYVRLGDASGFKLSNIDVNNLEAASTDLINQLPDTFKTRFKIYDFAFYPLNEYMDQNFTFWWESIKSKAQEESEYFLLIGLEANSKGVFDKIHIELNFPTEIDFDCVTSEQIKYLKIELSQATNKLKQKPVVEVEKEAIRILKNFILDKIVCCDTGNRNYCSNCLEDDKFIDYMEEFEFNITNVTSLTKTTYYNTSTNVKEYAKLTMNFDGEVVDVNQTIEDLVEDLAELSDSVSAEIRYFDLFSCDSTFNLVDDNPYLNSDDTYFFIKVIGMNTPLGDKISIKVETNLLNGKGTGTLYLLNATNLSTASIISKTKEFFQLTGLKIKLNTITKKSKIGKNDGFVVIGKSKSKVVDLIFGTDALRLDISYYDDPEYTPNPGCPACRPTKHECKQHQDIRNWPRMENLGELNPERSTLRCIMIDVSELNGDDNNSLNWAYSNNSDDNDLRKPGGTYRSIAYLILHGTAHQAGFHHDREPEGQAYCMDGVRTGQFLSCGGAQCHFKTYESLIEDAKKRYKYMIKQTNERYGY